jgi:hypothetical protein
MHTPAIALELSRAGGDPVGGFKTATAPGVNGLAQ